MSGTAFQLCERNESRELVVVDGRVVLSDPAVGFAPVSAGDVFRVTARNATEIDGSALDRLPPESCPGTVFWTRPLPVAVRISEATDRSSVRAVAVAEYEGELVEPHAVDDHVLIGSNWFPLEPESLALVRSTLAELAPEAWVGPAQYIALHQSQSRGLVILGDTDGSLLPRVIESIEPPPTLRAELRPYQRLGFAWLSACAAASVGSILADEMGLGKTLQCIALLSARTAAGSGPSLVVCPLTLVENWCRELAKFAPELRVYRHVGPWRARWAGGLTGFDVAVTTYETVVIDAPVLAEVRWDVVVADEAQAIKNPDSQRAMAVKQLERVSGIAVSGTPLENRPLDVWSLADFAIPGYLGSRSQFDAGLANHPTELRSALRPIMLRREVKDVANEMPPLVETDWPLDMFEDEAAGYDEIRKHFVSGGAAGNPLNVLTRLRQYTAHPSLGRRRHEASPASAKLLRLSELLEEIVANRDKCLVFAAFQGAEDLIAADAKARFVNAFVKVVDGRVPGPERQDIVDDFTEFEGPAILVLNPRAAGAGLNITAARHVIHYTLEWNPAVERQATARAWRSGQSHPVFVHRLFYLDSVDEVMDQRLSMKATLFERVVQPSQDDQPNLDAIARILGLSPVSQHSNP